MSDNNDDQTPDQQNDDADTGSEELQAELDKWKAMARKHEEQAKKNADAAKKLSELEDAKKSEIEKATEKAAEAEKRAEKAEARALRLEVAADKGLTPTQAKFLTGTNREEFEANADELLESFRPSEDEDEIGDKPGITRRPKENLKTGATSDSEGEDDPDEIADRILSRKSF